MSRNRLLVLLVIVLLVGCASSMTPRSNTREGVMAYVNHAADMVAKNGPSCDALKSSKWMSGDYYVWVVGPDGRLVCHPNAEMVGKSQDEIIDANGMRVGDALAAAGNSPEGHGWVEYVWPRPGQATAVAKSAYVSRVTAPDGMTYIVGGGGYLLK